MSKKASTDIKFSQIKKIAKEANETEVYEFDDGATLTFYPIFPASMIEEMFVEIQTVFNKVGDKLDLNEGTLHKFVFFHAIKHFTHLKSQLKATSLAGQLNEMNSIVDSGYYEIIINEVFLQSELNKIFDIMSKFAAQSAFFEKLQNKMQDELATLELKNKDVFENLKLKNKKRIPEA